jgi:hypothetical protein
MRVTVKKAPTLFASRERCSKKFANWILSLHIRVLAMGNLIKEAISIMKPKQIFISILAVLFAFPLMGTFAQQAPNSGSIEVIMTFDYPGTGNSTLPQKINERGDIVGEFLDSNGVTRGFIRFSGGSFSAPIVDPNDTVGFTEGRGINNLRTVCGDYLISDGTFHGFFLSGGTFTEYDIAGAANTIVLSINDAADFAGAFTDSNGIPQAFISLGGTITSFSVPGAIATFAYQFNNSNQLVVGYYIDSSGILHGYYRDANGALHFPIDPSGSVGTVLFGLNNRNWVVGRYADSSGVTHGLFFVPPNNFFTFDYPGSTFTSLNGISSLGFICGRYVDASGIAHGFLARAKGTPSGNEAGTLVTPLNPVSPVTPLNPSPSAWGGEMPAR